MMLLKVEKEEEEGRRGGERWRGCESCGVAAGTVYCRADSAYLCGGCDARVHAANWVASRHERVRVCESCERAPAAVTCPADGSAALCTACDARVHSANPLARRHRRVPILPIVGASSPVAPTTTGPIPRPEPSPFLGLARLDDDGYDDDDDEEHVLVEEEEAGGKEEAEAESWLLLNNPVKSNLFGGEVDEYLDLVEYNSGTENQYGGGGGDQQQQQQQLQLQQSQRKEEGSDGVVPVRFFGGNKQGQNFQVEIEYDEASSKAGFRCYSVSHSHSVSMSSMEASVVPDSTTTDISNSHSRPFKGTIDLFSGPPLQMPIQYTPLDREARVLRYREKRKMRKFEKTIRYASRKAYAETRPRIKGRFAKRSDVELEVDQMFSATAMAENSYGIVPSF